MNFRTLIIFLWLAIILTGCKATSGLKSSPEPVSFDEYKVWIEPSYAKSLRKSNGPKVRYQTIKIARPDLLTLQNSEWED